MKVSLKQLYKYYEPKKPAVRNIELEIPSGKLTTILGPSGCGKTTTMLMIAGLEKPSHGEIFFDHTCVTTVPPKFRKIGMVFQNSALYPNMSVKDNIMFPLRNQKVPKNIALERVKSVLRMVNLEGFEERKPSQLSGGQRQRVAIARAIAKEPDLLILDEPLSALDASLRMKMREEIKQLQQKLGITTIMVTHDQDEAMAMSDMIAVMKDGELQQYDHPLEIVHHPTNWFVASFLGMPIMNRLDCSYNFANHSLVIEKQNTTISLSSFNIPEHSLNQKKNLILGFRPHDVEMVFNKPDQKNFLRGMIKHVEHTGREFLITVVLESTFEEVKVICPTILVPREHSDVWIKINTMQFLFERDGSQQNIFPKNEKDLKQLVVHNF
ncbi:sugar ABC transporter ATP-binding protein [Bacillus canaveralius]|uniref:Sugar ABC transporter ATP-binding protein n=1 Tax=Bacillus canaveralius TaxID=1403243 RepID=A0A2N5GKM0_9BACI|nr:ABC transporter ATP-binding protein [Bacillus canaveralius]PLR82020.1 sugar ABC transporter ATP-binding protein [Bacillus canaveralius]PLR99406.1 sugar ABC transporter ATP-binding protein [Bacillus canaveralius]